MTMQIQEIFLSIQGEGILMGLPTIFIRTTGCNLRCSYCDTKYAYNGGKTMSIDDILSKIKYYSINSVCVTGGEPLLQPETIELITRLQYEKYKVSLETNGSQPIQPIHYRKHLMISMDLKMPSSTMDHQNLFDNIKQLSTRDQIKFIIKDKIDFEYAKQILNRYRPCCPVIFQPVWNTDLKTLVSWILDDGLSVRIGVQLHKIIWGEESKRY